MAFSLTKLLAAFGNIRAMEKLHVDDHTEAIINDIENEPFAVSESNILYAGFNELGGYYFLQTVVVGSFKVKTFNGAKLRLKGDGINLNLNSDMSELESDYSNVSKRYITKIDFEIEKSDLETLKDKKLTEIRLTSKKQDINFSKHIADKVGK